MRVAGPSRNIRSARPLCGDEGTADDKRYSETQTCHCPFIQHARASATRVSSSCSTVSPVPLTVRLAPASSYNLHRLGNHALTQREEKISDESRSDDFLCGENQTEARYHRSYHLLKVDQFVDMVRVSLVDERHVWSKTGAENTTLLRIGVISTSLTKSRWLLLPLSSSGMKGM